MNTFKFFGTDGRYLVAIPYRNKWLAIEEGYDNNVVQYMYVPGFPKEIYAQTINGGFRYVYGSRRLYLRHCTFKWVPSWVVGGYTI